MTRRVTVAGLVAGLASRRLAVITGLMWVGTALVLFVWQGRYSLTAVEIACGTGAPDTRFAPVAAETRSFLMDCGEVGLAAYRDLQIIDLLYPAVVGVFLASVLALLLRSLTPRAEALALVPLVATAADYAENACAWVLLAADPAGTQVAAALFQVFSAAKYVTSWAAWLMVIALLVAWVLRWVCARGPLGHFAGSRAPVARVLGE